MNTYKEETIYQSTINWKFTNPKSHIKKKLKIMRRDFMVEPTYEELAHLNTLTTEGDINRYCVVILDNHWGTGVN